MCCVAYFHTLLYYKGVLLSVGNFPHLVGKNLLETKNLFVLLHRED